MRACVCVCVLPLCFLGGGWEGPGYGKPNYQHIFKATIIAIHANYRVRCSEPCVA